MGHRAVIITGAGNGVGRAAALRFAAAGDMLVLVDPNENHLRSIHDSITEKGGTASWIQADISRKLDVHNVIAEALDTYERIDALAHCESSFFSANYLETTEEDFDRVVDANIRSAFLLNQAVAKQIIRQAADIGDGGVDQARSGAIVNVITTEAVTASADHAIFAATQGAVAQLTKAVAMTLSPYGARANAVGIAGIKNEGEESGNNASAPAATAPLARRGDPDEAASAIFFLASEEASFITGQTLFVDGGRLAQYRQRQQTEQQNKND